LPRDQEHKKIGGQEGGEKIGDAKGPERGKKKNQNEERMARLEHKAGRKLVVGY